MSQQLVSLTNLGFVASDVPAVNTQGWRFVTPYGEWMIAQHGAQVLSWIPAHHPNEVFWLSKTPAPVPAPLRGGIPVCWPWFAKQNVPASAAQHGVVRNQPWRLTRLETLSDGALQIVFAPAWQSAKSPIQPIAAGENGAQTPAQMLAWPIEAGWAPLEPLASASAPPVEFVRWALSNGIQPDELQVELTMTLAQTLSQTLTTYNHSGQRLRLTQALHSYFYVGDAVNTKIEGLDGITYLDKLQNFKPFTDPNRHLQWGEACDRIYTHPTRGRHHYCLTDHAMHRKIQICAWPTQTVVVWNPGVDGARTMRDVGDNQWRHFFCIEAAHSEPHGVELAPNTACQLVQNIAVSAL